MNPAHSRSPLRTLSRRSLGAGAVVGGLALLSAAGCGQLDAIEPVEEMNPVAPDQIVDNDPPLSKLHEVQRGFPGNSLLPFGGRADLVLPAKFDVYSLEAPVRNQVRRGVCSIFSTVGLMEMLYKKAGMASPDFSEQYLQWAVKVQDGAFPDSEGSSDYYNLETINKYGIPLETAWPYQPDPWTTANDPACTGDDEGLPTRCYTNGDPPAVARSAKKYKLPAGRWVSTSSIDVLSSRSVVSDSASERVDTSARRRALRRMARSTLTAISAGSNGLRINPSMPASRNRRALCRLPPVTIRTGRSGNWATIHLASEMPLSPPSDTSQRTASYVLDVSSSRAVRASATVSTS